MTRITVVEGRVLATDRGRFAGPNVGLPVNGALDQFSARVANAMVGNGDDLGVLEISALDTVLVADDDLLVAVRGATCVTTVAGVPVDTGRGFALPRGTELAVRGIRGGLRVYVAVAGGVTGSTLLGSMAPDPMIGFGDVTGAGASVETGPDAAAIGARAAVRELPLRPSLPARRTPGAPIRILPGPQWDEFSPLADTLLHEGYTVQIDSNHIGLRLHGRTPGRRSGGELLSRGVPLGAVEIPSPDTLLILHRGRGATAGYPVVAVVAVVDLDALAQCAPGETVRFALAEPATAVGELRRQESAILAVRDAMRRALTA